jgi:DNA-binding NarL/FixJ family response regulator
MVSPFSIAILDDHQLFLQGFSDYFSQLEVVKSITTFWSYEQFQEQLTKEIPDLLFLDLNLSGQSGFAICEQLKGKYPEMHIAILTQYDNQRFVQKAKKCGADAYFIKSTDPEILSLFLRCLGQKDIRGFFSYVPEPGPPPAFTQDSFELVEILTSREREVVQMIVNGCSHTEIENSLGISGSTFKMHRANIMQKLGIDNDVELGIFAVTHGLRKN